jgi:hypothetical protein
VNLINKIESRKKYVKKVATVGHVSRGKIIFYKIKLFQFLQVATLAYPKCQKTKLSCTVRGTLKYILILETKMYMK